MKDILEKLSKNKFLSGFTNPVNGAKTLVFAFWGLLFLLVAFTIYRAYFKKQPPTTTQNAEHIDAPNYYLQPKFGGCASIKIPK